jgi:hypothetical protein
LHKHFCWFTKGQAAKGDTLATGRRSRPAIESRGIPQTHGDKFPRQRRGKEISGQVEQVEARGEAEI